MDAINNKFNYLLLVLLPIAALHLSVTPLRIIGSASLVLFIGICSVLVILNLIYKINIPRKDLLVLITATVFILVALVSTLSLSVLSDSFYKLITYVSSILVFVYFMLTKVSKLQILISFCIFFLLGLITFLNFLFGTNLLFLIGNSNGIGMFLSFSLFFSILLSKNNKLFLFLSFVLLTFIVFTATRSVMIGLTFALFFYFLLVIIKKRYVLLSIIVILFIIVTNTIGYYINLKSETYFMYLNNLSMKYSGKNLLSGREEVWKLALRFIEEKPVFGYGLGSDVGEILNINLSLHNFYLQFFLQTGIIGLIAFLILLLSIFNAGFSKGMVFEKKISISIFAGYLVQQNFEVFLFENNLYFGLLILISGSISLISEKELEDD